jgi:hypothetical protein
MEENNLSLTFVCPLCGAGIQEQCHVQVGVVRDEPHSERVELANKALHDSQNAAMVALSSSAIYLVPAKRLAS